MKIYNYIKLLFVFSILITSLGCSKKEEVAPPDQILGNWEVYSIAGGGETIVWDELKETLVEIIPEYECMSFKASITEDLVTTTYVFPNVNANSCFAPEINVYLWERTSGTNQYDFVKGLIEVTKYNITVTSTQMTWVDQLDGGITIWNKI
jgi:hypothetical protein